MGTTLNNGDNLFSCSAFKGRKITDVDLHNSFFANFESKSHEVEYYEFFW